MCNETLQLSCSVSYSANNYVVANIKWFDYASSSEALKSSMKKSTSGKLTTATSTLKVTWPFDSPGTIPIYGCSTTFSLAANLPNEFVQKQPNYYNLCQPFRSAYDVPCKSSLTLACHSNYSYNHVGLLFYY